jgi:hypothetical protein
VLLVDLWELGLVLKELEGRLRHRRRLASWPVKELVGGMEIIQGCDIHETYLLSQHGG